MREVEEEKKEQGGERQRREEASRGIRAREETIPGGFFGDAQSWVWVELEKVKIAFVGGPGTGRVRCIIIQTKVIIVLLETGIVNPLFQMEKPRFSTVSDFP